MFHLSLLEMCGLDLEFVVGMDSPYRRLIELGSSF